MARVESTAAKGFYPLPKRLASMIGCKLNCSPGATSLDPVAGEGDAVMRIAIASGISEENIYANELDVERSKTLREALPNSQVFGPVDFLGAFHIGKVSIAYCNPPFDDELGGGGRIEWRFIDNAIDLIMPDGVAVIVIPERIAKQPKTLEVLSSRLSGISIFEFPDVDRKFGEVCILGYRRDKKVSGFMRYAEHVRPWGEIDAYDVPAGDPGGLAIRKVSYTEQELLELVADTEASKLLSPASCDQVDQLRPPMELRKGHMAMLLASGCMNGLVDTGGPDTHVVRGTCRKVTDRHESVEGREVTVKETERISLTVKLVTLDGTIVELTDKVSTGAEDEQDPVEEEVTCIA